MKPATDEEHWEGAHNQMTPSRKTCLKNEHTFRRESECFIIKRWFNALFS
jgi:hypothetical protein